MKRSLFVIFAFLLAIDASAAVRFTYDIGDRPIAIAWPGSSFPIHYSVSRDVVQQLPGSLAAIDSATRDWSSIAGSKVSFAADGAANIQAGRDGKNVIALNDRLFEGSGFVAFTTTFSDDSGTISEADIQIDTSVARNQNLQPIVEHELGHVLGLDHSPVVSAVMYPYLSSDGLARLDSDDRLAIAAIYPMPGALGQNTVTFHGTLRRTGAPLFAAQVVALDADGSPVASTLSDAQGHYEITGLPPGEYRLYAEPLDGPVDPKNLSGAWRVGTPALFRTGFLTQAPIHAGAGAVLDEGESEVDPSDPTLNPKWIGTVNENGDARLASTGMHVKAGDIVSIAVGGSGFVNGLTQFEIANSGFERISDFKYGTDYVWAQFRVAATTPLESTVVFVHNGNETAALTGAISVDAKTRARLVR